MRDKRIVNQTVLSVYAKFNGHYFLNLIDYRNKFSRIAEDIVIKINSSFFVYLFFRSTCSFKSNGYR